MSAMQQISQPVHWFEGMLLSPQHFQQNNQFMEQLMFHQLRRVAPYFYGLIDMCIDKDAFARNELLIHKIHAVMTDGTVVDSGTLDQRPLLCYDFNNLKGIESQKPFFIYLAVAHRQGPCAENNNLEMKRYESINTGKVVDQDDPKNQVDLVRLNLKLQILPENELSPNYSYLPLIKLQKNHDRSFKQLKYTPPLLKVSTVVSDSPAESTLGNKIDALIAELRCKATEQRNYFIEKQTNGAPLTNAQKLKLHHLSRCLPKLEVMIAGHKSHPYELYLAMIDLSAGVAILQDDILPPVYPKYNHLDLDETFKPVFKDIERIIKKLQLNFEVHALEPNQENEFQHLYTHQPDSKQIMLAFRLAAGVSREQLISWVNNAYFCTHDKLNTLLTDRIIGCERRKVEEFTQLEIKESEDEIFFIFEATSEFLTIGRELTIKSSDQRLDQYIPRAVNWFDISNKVFD